MKQAQSEGEAHTPITTTAELAALCERLAHEPFVTVDTEFMREKTYYPQLCLIQLAGEKEAAAVDPLAEGIDLAPLDALLLNPHVLKVFHACKQDMEIFFHRMRRVPEPIFDTQVAAMVCGLGESVGYETIVNKVLGKAVDKSSRFTDWARRPLSEAQITYALGDVIHLREVYLALMRRLEKSGRLSWIDEEMEPIRDPKTYEMDPNDAWERIRLRNTTPKYLASLQAVARWRELTARERNVPRPRIMKDDTLAEVAQAKPKDFNALKEIRGFYPTMSSSQYDSLFAAMREADELPSSAWPRLPRKPQFPEGADAIIDLLKMLLKACAEKHHVVPRLIASKDDLEALVLGKRDHIHTIAGWRREIFGEHALKLLDGKTAIKADGKNGIAFIDLP